MKLTNMVQCPMQGCARYFTITVDDVNAAHPLRTSTRCPICQSQVRVSRQFYDELKAAEKPEKKEAPAKQTESNEDQIRKALEVAEVLKRTDGNKTKAAEILSVSVQTIANRLKHLPAATAAEAG